LLPSSSGTSSNIDFSTPMQTEWELSRERTLPESIIGELVKGHPKRLFGRIDQARLNAPTSLSGNCRWHEPNRN